MAKDKHHMNSQGRSKSRQATAPAGRTVMRTQPIHWEFRIALIDPTRLDSVNGIELSCRFTLTYTGMENGEFG